MPLLREPTDAELIIHAADRLSSHQLGVDLGVRICAEHQTPLAGWEFTITTIDGTLIIHSFTDKEGSYRGRKVLDVEVGTHYKLFLVLRDSEIGDRKVIETEEDAEVLKSVNFWMEVWNDWLDAEKEGNDLLVLYFDAASEFDFAIKYDEFRSSARQKEDEAKNRHYKFDSLVQAAKAKTQRAWDVTLYVTDEVTMLQKYLLEVENRVVIQISEVKKYQRNIERAKKTLRL